MVTELLDCPFCGDSVDIHDSDTVYPTNRIKTIWQCGCLNPECCASVLGESREHALELWNTRSNQTLKHVYSINSFEGK